MVEPLFDFPRPSPFQAAPEADRKCLMMHDVCKESVEMLYLADAIRFLFASIGLHTGRTFWLHNTIEKDQRRGRRGQSFGGAGWPVLLIDGAYE